jgi:hypothetical protein
MYPRSLVGPRLGGLLWQQEGDQRHALAQGCWQLPCHAQQVISLFSTLLEDFLIL